MNLKRFTLALLISIGLSSALTYAQPDNPIVSLSITLPDGQTKTVSAPESGLATLTLADGTEFGFRPTIQDSRPWMRVVVTIFKMATASHPTEDLGEVEVRTGGAAVQSKTTPVFKVSVTKVGEATTKT